MVLAAAFFLGVFGGAAFYISTDTAAYIKAASAILNNQSVYGHIHSAYPPLFYGILAVLLLPVSLVTSISEPSYLTVLPIKLLSVGAVVTAAWVGARHLEARRQWRWLIFILVNPITIIGAFFYGQADSLVALALILAVIGWQASCWWLVGGGIAAAGCLKIYPIIAFIPVIVRHRDKVPEMAAGALPVFAFTGGLIVGELPEAVLAFFNPGQDLGIKSTSIRRTTPKMLAVVLGLGDLVRPVPLFGIGVVASLYWSIAEEFRAPELALIVPMLPAWYLTSYNAAYRWLPLVLVIGYLGYRNTGQFGVVLRRYAIAVSVIGGVSMGVHSTARNLSGRPSIHGTLFPTTIDLLTNYPTEIFPIEKAIWGALSVLHLGVGFWAWRHFGEKPPREDDM